MATKRKEFFKKLQVSLLPWILSYLVRAINLTLKKQFHIVQSVPDKPFILAFWHGELLFAPFAFFGVCKLPVSAMISDHRDGEAITKTVEYFGIGAVRGSSSRGGAKALISAIKTYKDGSCVAITPDGPKGPRHSVASGIVMLSQKLDADVVTLTIKPSAYWQFNSWDKFFIPKPFSKIDFYFSEPFKLTGLEEEEAKRLIKEKMMENVLI